MLILIIVLITPYASGFLEINEIMYDPEGNDNNKEFVEIFTDLNLSGFNLMDSVSEDVLEQTYYYPSNYSLIVEDGFNSTNINATVYSIGATIGNSLNNDHDLILIMNGSTILDAVHYYSEWGAENNGRTLCLIGKMWKECNPTPGEINTIEESQTQDIHIRINEFLPDPEGNDSASMPKGEWIELYNYGDSPLDLEGYKFKDDFGHTLIISDTTAYENIIDPGDYLVVYTNGIFGFLNNEGFEKIIFYTPVESKIDEVSYTDSNEGSSWAKAEDKWYITKPTPKEANPIEPEKELKSKIDINKVYYGNDDFIKFGETLRVRLEIYKGDDSKENIKAEIQKNNQKVSKTTSFNIKNKYSVSDITIPIQIIPNCNLKYSDGEYILKVEGLDETAKEKINIKGLTQELCEKQVIKEEIQSKSVILSASETNINPINTSEEITIFESKNKRVTRSGMYFFSFILVLLVIKFIIENGKNKS